METRIVEVQEFKVKGYEMKGPVSEIPAEWDKLISEIKEKGVVVEESFGVCLSMKGDEIHYVAGH